MTATCRPLVVLALAPLLLAAGASAPDPARALAGRYYAQHPGLTIVGFESEPYTGEDIVEIAPIAPRTAYVRAHLDYANGHYCAIHGIARAEGQALVYRDPRPPLGSRGSCILTIRRSGASLSIDDGPKHGCGGYCGVRGSLNNVKIAFSSKRPIRYMPRIEASREYRNAIAEWRTGRPVEP